MKPAEWQRIQSLFNDLVETETKDRQCVLDQECGDDSRLRRTLEGMLLSAALDDDFLVSPIEKAPEKATPRVLGDFEIIEEIGRGGMGVVYRANQRSLDREVAVKVLPQSWCQSNRQIQRFEQEARTAGRLQHPGIVTVYATGKLDDMHYFAMELIEGPNLTQLMGAHQFPEAAAEHPEWRAQLAALAHPAGIARVIAEVADALQVAHFAKLIHRDVKPSNLFMTPQASLKLGDFGLVLDSDSAALSSSGEVLGSPHYVSPEQAAGESELIDHRTDVYSLGVVLFELLTGKRPFDGKNAAEVLQQVRTCEPKTIRSLRAKVPRDLATICEVAMSKRPEDRYATAGEMGKDLRRALALEPIRARRLPLFARLARWSQRHRTGIIASALTLACSSALAVAAARASHTREIEQRVSHLESFTQEPNLGGVAPWLRASVRAEVTELLPDLDSLRPDQQLIVRRVEELLHVTADELTRDSVVGMSAAINSSSGLKPWAVDVAQIVRSGMLINEANELRAGPSLSDQELESLVAKSWHVAVPLGLTGRLGLTEQLANEVPHSDDPAAQVWLQEINPETGTPGPARNLGTCPVDFSTPTGFYRVSVRVDGYPTMEFERLILMETRDTTLTPRMSPSSQACHKGMIRIDPVTTSYNDKDLRHLPFFQHEFKLAPYWLDQTEVSNREYLEFVNAFPERRPAFLPDELPSLDGTLAGAHGEPTDGIRLRGTGADAGTKAAWYDLPAVGMTVADAQAYAEWRGKRLPTLPEFIYAACGSDGRQVPWAAASPVAEGRRPGGSASDTAPMVYLGNCLAPRIKLELKNAQRTDYLLHACSVLEHRGDVSPFGVFHMMGNVSEITGSLIVARQPDGSFQTSTKGRLGAGSWWFASGVHQTMTKSIVPAHAGQLYASARRGFRCARSE